MNHIANFIHFFSVGLGLLSIYIALNLRKRTGYKVLTPYIQFLITLNLVIFLVHFMEVILRSLVGDESYETYLWQYFRHMILILAVLRMFMALFFLRFSFQLIQKRLSKYYNYLAGIVLLPIIVSMYFFDLEENAADWAENLSILLVHLTLGVAMIYGSLLVLRQREKVEWLVPEMIPPTFRFMIIYAIAGILLRILNLWADYLPPYIVLPGVGLLALAFNGLNLLYLKQVIRMPVPVVQISDSQLISKYGITGREQEIIRLICQGKTNKEIGEILYISPITVRDHTSNIFRKTGVKSRTQLAHLFMERPAG